MPPDISQGARKITRNWVARKLLSKVSCKVFTATFKSAKISY